MATSAWANVTLKLPRKVSIVAQNGKKIKIAHKASLPDGENQIVVQFQGNVGPNQDDADFLYSDAFVLRFNASNQQLKMVVPRINRRVEFEIWNQEPDIKILDSADRAIDFKIARLEKEGILILRDYGAELAAFNKTNSPAALSTLSTVVQEPVVEQQVPAASAGAAATGAGAAAIPKYQQSQGNGGMAEDMLEYWYQQADEETKARFKQRVNQQ